MIKRVVINMIILLHYAMVYCSQVILDKLVEYRNDINMDTSRPKWDKKSAPYCETP